MISTFIVFLAGHLIGDFPLQTGKIASGKTKSNLYLILHVAIVAAITGLLLSFFSPYWIVGSIYIFVVHFLIDRFKGAFSKRFHIQTPLFCLDQVLHLISIVFISFNMNITLNSNDTVIILFLIIAVIISYTGTILAKTILRDLYTDIAEKAFFISCERIVNAAFCSLVFLSFILFNGALLYLALSVIFLINLSIYEKVLNYKPVHTIFFFSSNIFVSLLGMLMLKGFFL